MKRVGFFLVSDMQSSKQCKPCKKWVIGETEGKEGAPGS